MWTTIALQFLYIGITGGLSWYFTKQNKLAREVRELLASIAHLKSVLTVCRARGQLLSMSRVSDMRLD
jgi:hypothetical protein